MNNKVFNCSLAHQLVNKNCDNMPMLTESKIWTAKTFFASFQPPPPPPPPQKKQFSVESWLRNICYIYRLFSDTQRIYVRMTRALMTWLLNNLLQQLFYNVNKNPTRCNSMRIFIYCNAALHVSGVTTPNIRSIKNCNRSLRYRS